MPSTPQHAIAQHLTSATPLELVATAAPNAREAALTRIATLRLEARIPSIVDALSRKGVATIVLKGPSTRHRLYEPEEVRPTGDIDLLVAPRHQRRAARTLSRLGFRRIDSMAHADSWRSPDGTDLDLHRTIPYAGVEPAMAWRVLSLHVVPLDLPSGTIPVLNVPAHFVHLAVQAIQSAQPRSPRPLEELRRAVDRTSTQDRAAADHIAEVLGLTQVVDVALSRLDDLGHSGHGGHRDLPVVHPRASTVSAYGSLRFWLHAQTRPMPVGRMAIVRAKARRSVVVSWRRLVESVERT